MFNCNFSRLVAPLALVVLLSGCAAQQRADNAAAAKSHMLGLPKEEVLACMGPPKQKSTVGSTEVWSYLSTNGYGHFGSSTYKPTGYSFTSSSHEKSFCTVNIVMKEGVVAAVHYNGPTSSSLFAKDEQCGYAIANCVEAD